MNHRTKATRLAATALLLGAVLAGCSAPQTGSDPAPTLPQGVAVNAQAGELSPPETRLLAELNAAGIPVPDSIVIVADTLAHGWVDPFTAPNTIHLTTERMRYPNAEIPEGFPYLLGRTQRPDAETFRRYVLAHEIAHILAPRLEAEMGRPALGVDTRTTEVQADILARVLLRAAQEDRLAPLGYPDRVEYPHIRSQTTDALQRQYCVIVEASWEAELDCYNR
jgi:hypothetical protein